MIKQLLHTNYIRLLFMFALLLAQIGAIGQTTSFMTYGMEQGIIQSQVQDLCQDNEGNLWIGTIAGLTKYNGSSFESFTKNQGLAEDWITSCFKDSKGNIWLGHWAGNVTRYNHKTKRFEDLLLDQYTRFRNIQKIGEDPLGRMWIATEGAGVFVYEPEKNSIVNLQLKDGLSSNIIYDFCFDTYQNIWLATDSGLTVYNFTKPINQASSFLRIQEKEGLFSPHITAIHLDDNKNLWLGSADKGLAVLSIKQDPKDQIIPLLSKEQFVFGPDKGLTSTFIKTIYSAKHNGLWVGTAGGGAAVFVPEKSKPEDLRLGQFKTYSTRQGLNYFNVNAILEDREGSLWIATDLGLNQYRGERMQIFDEADNIPNNIVWSLCKDHEDNIWLGTNNGLSKLTFHYEADNKIEHHEVKNYTTADGLASNTILSLFEDSKDNLWVGTGFSGVNLLSKGNNRFSNLSIEQGLASNVIYSICEDKDGNIWFGTKAGASRYNPHNQSIRNFTSEDGLGGNHIYRIFKDSKGKLWFGALGGNLCSYDGTSFKIYDENTGLKHKFILCIDEDKKGNLWFGCYGGGLYKFDGKTFSNYTMRHGLSSDSPFSLLVDDEEHIWIGNNRGIDKLNLKNNYITHYGRHEGFLGVECNPNAAIKDKLGNLWFGTIMGVVKFNPKEDHKNEIAPIISLNGLQIHLKDTIYPADAEFKYHQNNLTFKFIGISLCNPEKVKYEYTLDGFDKGWIPVNHLVQKATYTNLSPGTYTFKVRSCNNDGVWSKECSYQFTVKPPFWQTALFYVMAFVFIVFVLFVYDKLRTNKLKKAKAELEEKVRDRTRELAVKNEELAEKNKDITDSIRYAKRIQDASLDKREKVKALLPNSFILFRPKDIVSGDFFWIKEKNGHIWAAVIDCTGHGVPGAILSVVANNLLNKTFDLIKDQTSPAEFLNQLSVYASTALQSSTEQYQLRDGMDIALMKFSQKEGKISYAGAYNSLYLIRDNKVIEYPADHLSIGNLEEKKNYTHHEIPFTPGDQFYLFTDGFADQFGGERGKKYKYRHFQEFLLKNNRLNCDEQGKMLEKEFDSWKGKLEQVDDVCVIGIKVGE